MGKLKQPRLAPLPGAGEGPLLIADAVQLPKVLLYGIIVNELLTFNKYTSIIILDNQRKEVPSMWFLGWSICYAVTVIGSAFAL